MCMCVCIRMFLGGGGGGEGLCLLGCFSMIVWTPTVFECLICTRFLFLCLHLFSAVEHVSHGKML